MAALRLGLVIVAGALALAAAPAERAGGPGPSAPLAGAAPAPAADTLRASVRAGQTLIVALPDGAEYEVVRAPALSWLVDRSFMWRTLERERGTLAVEFRRRGAADDTLVLLVEILP